MRAALILTAPLAVCALAACQPEPAGKPVARVDVSGSATATATTVAPTPSPSIDSEVESACRSVIFENIPITDCLAVPERHRIVAVLADAEKANYRSLAAYAKTREAGAIAFAMNAGMFDGKGDPLGYFVAGGNRLHALSNREGENVFGSRTSGVFFGSGDKWEIRAADDFLKNVTQRPDFGTQSGPMLVTDGALNPGLERDDSEPAIRNAVGVDEQGRAHFVISNAPVSFARLGRFFRDELKARNALYLDGSVSQLWNPATERLDTGKPIGPILVVERKQPDGE